ncbi:hypothetical protein GCM10027590_42360 [Nocardiopsis nanhaiensis]
MATLRNTAIGLIWAAGLDNITEANRRKLRDENRQLSPPNDLTLPCPGALGKLGV